jgi:hypothetical protein
MVPHWEPILEIGLFIAGFRHRIQYRSTAGPHPNMILCPPSHQNYLMFFGSVSLSSAGSSTFAQCIWLVGFSQFPLFTCAMVSHY